MTQANLPALIGQKKAMIAATLPKHLNVDRYMRMAVVEYGRNPSIRDCDPMTILGSVVKAATLGLEISNDIGHCYLVPFNNRKTGVKECQLITGYKGLIDLARRSGQINTIVARVVHEKDHFEYELGLEERLVHRPATGPAGKMTHVYAVASFKDGAKHFEVLTADDVEQAKNFSKAKSYGPWVDNYEEMAKKTAIRRIAKYLPLSPEFADAQTLEADAPQDNHTLIDPAYEPVKTLEPTLLAEADKDAASERLTALRQKVWDTLEKLEVKCPDWMARLKMTEAPNLDKMSEQQLQDLGAKCLTLMK